MRRVGIFGGSFDPVHEGHIHLADLARKAASLDEVWFLPCRISPHKTASPPTPAGTRVEWLKLAIADLAWAKIESCELENEGPSYSFETMQALARAHPGTEWFWIMGGDQWTALPTWRHPEVLANLVKFIVLARNGQEVLPRAGYRLEVVRGEHPASSTAIRAALAAGETGIPFLNPAIARRLTRPLD